MGGPTYLVQARRQEGDFNGGDGQLAREIAAALLGLWVGAGREASDANDVASPEVDVLLIEVGGVLTDIVGLGEHLEPRALQRVSLVGAGARRPRRTSERMS